VSKHHDCNEIVCIHPDAFMWFTAMPHQPQTCPVCSRLYTENVGVLVAGCSTRILNCVLLVKHALRLHLLAQTHVIH
jgi:Ni2+-binding GTPase involved in maturation of urease and hydrogenase